MKVLPDYIRQAMDSATQSDTFYPWLGENIYEIMAKAAICVLEGMEDEETYLIQEGKLED